MAMRLMSHYHNLYFKIFLIFYLKEFELFNKENYKILKIMYIMANILIFSYKFSRMNQAFKKCMSLNEM